MLELKQTETFRKWRLRLKDQRARALIASRLDRLAQGNAGDVEPVGEGVSELRIHYGPGYRVYFQKAAKHDHRAALWRRQEHPGERHQDGEASCRHME